MSKAGESILRGARQALAHAKGESRAGYVVHVPEQVDVKAIRKELGLTQEEFADRYGFVVSTIRDWEQRRFVPDRPARALLKLIKHKPKVVARVLARPETQQRGRTRRESRRSAS